MKKAVTKIDSIIQGLKLTLESDGCEHAAHALATCLKALGAEVEIEADDDEADDMGSDNGCLWVVSEHKLLIDGEMVATWTRCSQGWYAMNGEWCTEEDTNGGDVLPEAIAMILDAFGIEDRIPDVPEPAPEDEIHETDPNGEYAVYWETVGDDAHVVARYATQEAAEAVCDQRGRDLRGRYPGGNLLCGYSVRALVNGRWVRIDD